MLSIETISSSAHAQSVTSGISYNGRIVRPDGSPVDAVNVQFKMQIRSPGSENCLLYEELQYKSLAGLNGRFSITINDGSGSRGDDIPTTGTLHLTLDDVFQNRTNFSGLKDCASGGTTYNVNDSDGRRFSVYFKEPGMTDFEEVPATKINYVPFALDAKKVGGFTAANLLRVDASSSTTLLSSGDFTKLLELIAGTSGQYAKYSTTTGVVVPNITMGGTTTAVAGSVWYEGGKLMYSNGSTTPVEVGAASAVDPAAQWTPLSGNVYRSTGRVGIGTSSPAQPLDVVGNISSSTAFYLGSSHALSMPSSESLVIGRTSASQVSGNDQTAIGTEALQSLIYGNGAHNTAVGTYAAHEVNSGEKNTAMGRGALYSDQGGHSNTAIGYEALFSVKQNGNTAIGETAGRSINAGYDNIFVGRAAGINLTAGNGNIFLGISAQAPNATGSNQLNIGGVIYGDLSTSKIGIGTTSPTATLDVKGHIANSATGTPVLSSCGGGSITGNDTRGTVVIAGGVNVCTLTFSTPYSSAPVCVVSSANTYGGITSASASAITISMGSTNATLNYICMQ